MKRIFSDTMANEGAKPKHLTEVSVQLPDLDGMEEIGLGASVCLECHSVLAVAVPKRFSDGFIPSKYCPRVTPDNWPCDGQMVAISDGTTRQVLDLLFAINPTDPNGTIADFNSDVDGRNE